MNLPNGLSQGWYCLYCGAGYRLDTKVCDLCHIPLESWLSVDLLKKIASYEKEISKLPKYSTYETPGDIEYRELVVLKRSNSWCVIGRGCYYSGYKTKEKAEAKKRKLEKRW